MPDICCFCVHLQAMCVRMRSINGEKSYGLINIKTDILSTQTCILFYCNFFLIKNFPGGLFCLNNEIIETKNHAYFELLVKRNGSF